MNMAIQATYFTGREIAPSARQCRSGGPNLGWFRSHASSRGEERAKHQAAAIRKMVVGKSGVTAPIAPIATIRQPRLK